MKQFIVLAAVLPIMLVFVAQFSLEAVRSLRMSAADDAIRAFCIEAAYYGGGGPAEAEALRHKLAGIFRADPQEVWIELTQAGASHIGWRASFPVGEIMAGARFMGLSHAENRGRVQMSGVIVIPPPPPEPLPPPEYLPPEGPGPGGEGPGPGGEGLEDQSPGDTDTGDQSPGGAGTEGQGTGDENPEGKDPQVIDND